MGDGADPLDRWKALTGARRGARRSNSDDDPSALSPWFCVYRVAVTTNTGWCLKRKERKARRKARFARLAPRPRPRSSARKIASKRRVLGAVLRRRGA